MHVTNISAAKTHLSALIEKVVAGEEVIIGKAGKPVAKLLRYERSTEGHVLCPYCLENCPACGSPRPV